jgi:serine/threonine protein kinase
MAPRGEEAAVDRDAGNAGASDALLPDAVSPDAAPSVSGPDTTLNLRRPESSGGDAPAAELRQFEALCDEFERSWQTEATPRIEDFLARSPQSVRERLFRALLQLETDYRSDRGEAPGADEYRGRFPQDSSIVDDVFRGSDVLLVAGDKTAVAPKRFGEYELGKVVGRGGMGVVFQAFHLRLKRRVALKMLPKEQFNNAEAVARFEHEMAAIGRLSHPNIVAAHDAGEFEGTHYLVMEYVDGVNLAALLERVGPLAIGDACELARQTAVALEYARAHGLVHRDIKPSNLMLTTDGVVKVLDMGLARLRSGADDEPEKPEGLTQTGQIVGTLDYLAPEQVDNCRGVDTRADIYSLGVTLYELLTGKLPLPTDGLTLSRRLLALVDARPTPIENYRADVPVELRAVVHRCLAKRPEDRFATPADLAAALMQHAAGCDLGSLGGNRGSTPGGASTPGAGPTKAAGLKTTETFVSRYRLSRGRGVVAGSIAAAALAAIAYALIERGEPDVAPASHPSPAAVPSPGQQDHQLLVHLVRSGREFDGDAFVGALPAREGDDIRLVVNVPEGLEVELWAIDSQGAIQEFTGGVFDPMSRTGRRFIYPADELTLPLDDHVGTELVLAVARPKGTDWRRPLRERLEEVIAGEPLPAGIPQDTLVHADLDKEFVRSADEKSARGFGPAHEGALSRLEALRKRVAALRQELTQEPDMKMLSITAFPHEKK